MVSGSGACASVVAAVENGFCSRAGSVRGIQNGGDMMVSYSCPEVILNCRMRKAFKGTVDI